MTIARPTKNPISALMSSQFISVAEAEREFSSLNVGGDNLGISISVQLAFKGHPHNPSLPMNEDSESD